MSDVVLSLSVHQLIDFLLRQGDIDSRVYNQETMRRGTLMHSSFQSKQGKGFESEFPLAATIEVEEGIIHLRGRADGIITNEKEYPIIDEIKSTVEDLNTFFESQEAWHLGQALCYAYMYLDQFGGEWAGVRLTYLHQIKEGESLIKDYVFTRSEIVEKVKGYCSAYLQFQSYAREHVSRRDVSVQSLQFPYESFRDGQREMSKYVYGLCQRSGVLFVEAPTGIGKTMSALFPAVRSFKKGKLDRLFYLTAKSTGADAAHKAVLDLKDAGLDVISSYLMAKERICFMKGHACNPDDCPFAKGYYSKLKAAILEALSRTSDFTPEFVMGFAQEKTLCPFEFQLDLSLWSDVIVCDYNYFFDPFVYLQRFFSEEADASTSFLLVDEAHNLLDRGKDMYSCILSRRDCEFAYKSLKGPTFRNLKRALGKVKDAFDEVNIEGEIEDLKKFPDDLERVLSNFKKSTQKQEMKIVSKPPDHYLNFSREINRALKILENHFDPSYRIYFEKAGEDLCLNLLCLDPSAKLQETLRKVKGAVLFSATLSPISYYQKAILGKDDYPYLLLPSPFPKEHFHLMIAPKVSVRYKDRARSYPQVAELLEEFVKAKKGNYFIFFPSYEYLRCVNEYLRFPHCNVYPQTKKMSEEDRQAFLANFPLSPKESNVGLLVLGGVFSEGIDMVSDRLIGVAIVGIGLPSPSHDNELLREYRSEQGLEGFNYAYRNPGMNRVNQALGRLIRSETDIGAALLIDDRYMTQEYRGLFARMYSDYAFINSKEDIRENLSLFYQKNPT